MYILGDMALVNSDVFYYCAIVKHDNNYFLYCKIPDNADAILIKKYYFRSEAEKGLMRVFAAFEKGVKFLDLTRRDEQEGE